MSGENQRTAATYSLLNSLNVGVAPAHVVEAEDEE